MSAEPSFARALLPDRHTAAGVRLRPLSLGHALLLQRLGSPLAARPLSGSQGQSGSDFGRLAQAVCLCSRPWRAAWALVDTRRERWWLAWHVRRFARAGEGFVAAVLAWHAEAWPEIPLWRDTSRTGKARGADLLHVLVLTERKHLGLSLEAALDVPLAAALWDHAAHWEDEGSTTIQGHRDRAVFDLCRSLTPKAGGHRG